MYTFAHAFSLLPHDSTVTLNNQLVLHAKQCLNLTRRKKKVNHTRALKSNFDFEVDLAGDLAAADSRRPARCRTGQSCSGSWAAADPWRTSGTGPPG